MAVESGAAESVIPADEVPDYPKLKHAEDIFYQTASGEPLPNLGQQDLLLVTPNRRLRGMRFQSCEVTKPLAAVVNMVDAGQAVIFAPEQYGGSCVVDLESGEEEPLIREDGNYILECWVPPHSQAGFGRLP